MQDITLHEVGGDLVINVPNESTVIGRGQFLQVTDKRVSRSHALLEVSDGKLYITPTHTNPCFLRTQGSKDQRALARDVKQHLDHDDEFGLLPDQYFYKVSYPQLNGNERDGLKKEDSSPKGESLASGESVSNGIAVEAKDGGKPQKKEASEDVDKSRKSSTSSLNNDEEKEEKENSSEEEDKEDNDKVEVEGQGDMTLPLKKKRALPDWMEKVAESPTKSKPPAKKPKPAPASKKSGTKLPKAGSDNDISDEEDAEHTSGKPSKGQKAKDSDEDFGEEVSDDDYVPEKPSKKRGGKVQKKKRTSDSEDDFSNDDDDDDDYSPKKSKSKASKKTAKGKGSARAKKTPVRAPRSTPQRSRAKKKGSDLDEEDDDGEALPRRRRIEEEDSTLRRPQRAARQKRGSYVDDPMIEEALEDFASDNDNDLNEDKDSDFMVEGEEESGSDWEKSASSSQKQKASKGKNKGPPKGPTKRVASKKKKPRRLSKAKDNSDEDEDEMEDDEPYVPRPSKRRGGTMSHDSEESDEGGNKKKRRREPCQYGKKCYRKNPVHFRTYCHPGDSSYDEEDKDSSSPKEVNRKEKESRTGSEKPSRPQRSTAGTRLVTHGTDDGTADDNEEGMQHTDESGADDSDYIVEPDAQERGRDAKKVQKNKKPAKPVVSDE